MPKGEGAEGRTRPRRSLGSLRPTSLPVAAGLAMVMAVVGLPSVPFVPLSEDSLAAAEAQVTPPARVMFDVDTVAGNGDNATVDGAGAQASFADPRGVAVSGGFAYVGTYGSIRKVNLNSGVVTTLAGHPTATGCTDHSDPAQVRFQQVGHLSVIGDWLYSVHTCGLGGSVRKTSLSTGATSTLASPGIPRSLTVGPDGFLYVTGGQSIWKVNPQTGDATGFGSMNGQTHAITSDATHLWVAWAPSGQPTQIERFAMDSSHTTFTFEGTVASTLLESVGGHLYATRTVRQLVRFSKADGSVEVLAGSGDTGWADGTGPDAWFGTMYDLAWDGAGVVVADGTPNRRVRRAVEADALEMAQSEYPTTDLGLTIGTVRHGAGDGQYANENGAGAEGGPASFARPDGIVIHDGYAYVGTEGAIRRVDLESRQVSTLAGSLSQMGCVSSPDSSQVRFKEIKDLDTDGHYIYAVWYCGIYGDGRVTRTSIETGATSTVACCFFVDDLTVGPDGMIYVVGGQGLRRIDPVDGTIEMFVWYTGGEPRVITSDDEYLWVVRSTSPTSSIERIRISDQTRTTFFTSGTIQEDIVGTTALESAGRYLYALTWFNAIRIYDKETGDMIHSIAGWVPEGYVNDQGTLARFNNINGIASDGEFLWVADRYNNRIRKIGEGVPIGEMMGECQLGTGESPLVAGDEWMETWCADQADPVNSATGAFHTRVRDAAMPGIGIPFRLVRRYNTLNDRSGPLGLGWTHAYDYGLTVETGGHVAVRLGDGRRLKFHRQSDGDFWGGPGMRATLETEGTGHLATTRSGMEYRFNAAGRLTSITDRNGNDITLTYDGSGNIDDITDTAGRVVSLVHNGSNRLTSVSLPGGREITYGYTGGLLTSVTDLRGKTWTYEYDAQSRLKKIVDPNGHNDIVNTYGAGGRVVAQEDPLGNDSTFSWDPATETSVMTDAKGKAWTDVYDGGKLIRRIDPLGNTTRYRYGGRNLKSITDPRGNKTAFSYDGRGNMTKWTAPVPLSYTETWAYNARNDVTSYTDGRNNTTTYEYDAAGNLIKVTEPGSVTTQLGRDPAGTGLLTSVTDPRNKVATFQYDSQGNLTRATSPLGNATTRGYDASGRMTSLVEPRGNVQGANPDEFKWQFTHDNGDNLLTRTDPLGNQTQWTYDNAGNLATMVDAKSRTASYGYNAADELTSVTAPGSVVTSYGYDQVGNLTSRTDPNNHTTTYGYDDAQRLTSVTSPINQVWTYQYDSAGNPTTVTTALGNSTPDPTDGKVTYSWDALNRLTGIDYSDSTPDVTFSYDANGNRAQMTDGAGTETSTYDALNRLTQVSRGPDSFSYLYDPDDNVTRRTYPDGTVVDYTYDDDDRMVTASSGGATTTYGYDPAANLLTTTLPASNGYVETRTYDRAGRLTEVKNAKDTDVLSRFTLTLDGVGNPTQVLTPTETITYQYDSLDRLTEACYQASCPGPSDPFIRYAYDPVGNRTTETRPSGTTTFTYNDGDHLTSSNGPGGTTNYAYDQNGNQTQAGSRTFAFDLVNRMTSTTLGGSTISYSYDGVGKRLEASSGAQPEDKTRYLWDPNHGLYQLALEQDGAGALRRRYVHGRDLISMRSGGSDSYYHYDPLGSVVNLTSVSGATHWSYAYEPFGAIRSETGSGPLNLMRFTGELFDQDPSLYHLRARQYNPVLGRLLSPDPLDPTHNDPYVSAYVYASNRPTSAIDPSGLRSESLWEGGFASVWWEGFQLTPTWVKVAVGATILVSGVFVVCYFACPVGAAAIPATAHGAQRLTEQGWSRLQVAATRAGQVFTQADGATVFVKEVSKGRFNMLVEGARGVVTAHKNLPASAIKGFAERFGWIPK